MIRIVTIAAALAVLALTGAAPAQASWFLSRGDSEHATREIVHQRYNDYGVSTRCRPQFVAYQRGFDYHRWVCDWLGLYDNPDGQNLVCTGRLLIAGSRNYEYQYRIMRGERCK
jgi:hypothetical protein